MKYTNILNDIKSKNINETRRKIRFQGGEVCILFLREITDRAALSKQVIRPLVQQSGDTQFNAMRAADNIYSDDYIIEKDEKKIESLLLNGRTVVLFSNDNHYIVINLKKVAHRSIPAPDVNYILRGPKDCFIEHLETNLSLIRYRLKDVNLRIDIQEVGKRTKSRVAVIYIEDIANNTSVTEVKKRISRIDIDGILESGELQSFISNNSLNLFPQVGIVERSDMACGALLEGKVVTLVDGTGTGLIAPKVLSEFLWTCEDFYDNKIVSVFLRLLRIISLILSFTISSLYVAIVSFHNDILPSNYIIAIAESRNKVPFDAVVEVLLIEIIVEMLKEAMIRVPKKYGTAIGIVGAIIIGEAAISAGIFSPLLLIVVAISMITSFIPSDHTLVNSFRLLKFLLIIATGMLGLYGFILVLTVILTNLVSINTFGVPYMAPLAPFNWKDFFKSFFYSKPISPTRPEYLKTKDKIRGKTND